MNSLKRAISILITLAMLTMLFSCGSSEPCESCGKSPTKAYMNKYHNEKEYYCSGCSSYCDFCSDKATEHYTSALGTIIFACEDCYEKIKN